MSNDLLENLKIEKEKSFNFNKKALDFFEQANKFLYSGYYTEAEENIKKYKELIDYNSFYRIDNRGNKNPKISVIIVSYNSKEKLLECVNSLLKNNLEKDDYEIIIIDNGQNDDILEELLKCNLLYIQNPVNLNPSEGRNIGTYFSNASIVAFLDDDALVSEKYIENIIKNFDDYPILGLRGKILSKTDNINNKKAGHYDLGNDNKYIDIIGTEGNSAFRKDKYKEISGMNPLLFGHEGIEISYRISKKFGNNKILYSPEVIIYHDFANTNEKLERKESRHIVMMEYLKFIYPTINEFINGIKYHVKFSIIMSTYNRKNCIKDAIDSIFNQTYQNFELIIVDDGSTDGTEEYIKEIYKKEIEQEKIKYIKISENMGASYARNEGLKIAKNEWIGYLDTDNKMYQEFLETYAKYISENPEYKIFYAKIKHRNSGIIIGHEFSRLELLKNNYIDNNVIVNNKSLFEELGGYREKINRLIDHDLVLRYTHKYKPYFIDKVLIDYYDGNDFQRITNSNPDNKNFKDIIIDYYNNIPEEKFIEEYFKDFQELDNFKNQEKIIKDKIEELREKDEIINQKDTELKTKDEIINQKDFQINAILDSTSWKITKPIRLFKDKIKQTRKFLWKI